LDSLVCRWSKDRSARAAKGLTKVFDTGVIPNPAFVEMSGKAAGDRCRHGRGHGDRLRRRRRDHELGQGRTRALRKDVLVKPPTTRDTAMVDVRHHFVCPPGARLE